MFIKGILPSTVDNTYMCDSNYYYYILKVIINDVFSEWHTTSKDTHTCTIDILWVSVWGRDFPNFLLQIMANYSQLHIIYHRFILCLKGKWGWKNVVSEFFIWLCNYRSKRRLYWIVILDFGLLPLYLHTKVLLFLQKGVGYK